MWKKAEQWDILVSLIYHETHYPRGLAYPGLLFSTLI